MSSPRIDPLCCSPLPVIGLCELKLLRYVKERSRRVARASYLGRWDDPDRTALVVAPGEHTASGESVSLDVFRR